MAPQDGRSTGHDDPLLVEYVARLAAPNEGWVFAPDQARLGEYVVSDYPRAPRSLTVYVSQDGPRATSR